MTEDRAAQILNITVALVLGALVLGFLVWSTVTGFGDVRAIYRSLPSGEQKEVDSFLRSAGMLTWGVIWALAILSRWNSHPVIRWTVRSWPVWMTTAAGIILLGLGERLPGLVWLGAAAILLAATLFNRWRARRRPTGLDVSSPENV